MFIHGYVRMEISFCLSALIHGSVWSILVDMFAPCGQNTMVRLKFVLFCMHLLLKNLTVMCN